MTRRWARRGATAILILMGMLWVAGCSFSSPLLSMHDKKRTLIIERPPIRIYASGQFDDLECQRIKTIIGVLDKCEYHPYKFNNSFSVNTDIDLSTSHSNKYDSRTKIR